MIRSYSEDQRYRQTKATFRSRRRTIRILCKVAVCLCSLSTCAVILWLALFMRRALFTFVELSATELDHNQSIYEADFGYFGPQLENAWRAFLIANLGLAFLTSLYIPLGVLFEHYYPVLVYGSFMFLEAVLSIGNEYMAVPYYLASVIFFLTGLTVHVYVHFLRLDLVDEAVHWRRYEAQELLRRAAADELLDGSHERSSSFEVGSIPSKSSLPY